MFIFAVIAGIVAGVVIEIRRMMDDRAMRLYEEGKDAYFDGDKLNPRWPRAKREGSQLVPMAFAFELRDEYG